MAVEVGEAAASATSSAGKAVGKRKGRTAAQPAPSVEKWTRPRKSTADKELDEARKRTVAQARQGDAAPVPAEKGNEEASASAKKRHTAPLSTTVEYEVQACHDRCIFPCLVHARQWDRCFIVDQNDTHADIRITADNQFIQNVHKRSIREVGSGVTGPRASRSGAQVPRAT